MRNKFKTTVKNMIFPNLRNQIISRFSQLKSSCKKKMFPFLYAMSYVF